jgi:NADH-quinone oxidoreductase subunit C
MSEARPPGAPQAAAPEAPPPEPVNPIVARLRELLGEENVQDAVVNGQLIVTVPPTRIVEASTTLRDDAACRFDHLADVTATDYLEWNPDGGPPGEGRSPRFDVVYHLYSIPLNHRVRVKVKVDEDDVVPSVTGVWPAANWGERETYDMYGITFSGHPYLARLLMPDDWGGHPLRKDYPLIEEEIEFSKTLSSLNQPLRPVHQRSLDA